MKESGKGNIWIMLHLLTVQVQFLVTFNVYITASYIRGSQPPLKNETNIDKNLCCTF